jgi:hypothetical protein
MRSIGSAHPGKALWDFQRTGRSAGCTFKTGGTDYESTIRLQVRAGTYAKQSDVEDFGQFFDAVSYWLISLDVAHIFGSFLIDIGF